MHFGIRHFGTMCFQDSFFVFVFRSLACIRKWNNGETSADATTKAGHAGRTGRKKRNDSTKVMSRELNQFGYLFIIIITITHHLSRCELDSTSESHCKQSPRNIPKHKSHDTVQFVNVQRCSMHRWERISQRKFRIYFSDYEKRRVYGTLVLSMDMYHQTCNY